MTEPIAIPAPPPEDRPPPVAAPAPAGPYAATDLARLLRRPGETFEVVLARRDRLAATITDGTAVWSLALALAVCTALASLPYGLVRGGDAWWRIAVLFSGSVLLCYPALQVFGAYLGSRLRPSQNLALALVVSGVGGLFTLGFAPIVWFLEQTMRTGDTIDTDKASVVMLAAALLAGLVQLSCCAAREHMLRRNAVLLVAWQLLVICVALRMARSLSLV